MDVGHLGKARSGSAFLAYGTGDVRIKILGDQDEDVDIDDGDTDTAPYIDASLAGATGGGTGVGTGAKSMAGSTLAPRVGVANVVSSTSSHGRREPHTAGSQASIGRQTLPQLTAGEDGSPKYSDGSVPKVSTEGTSKRVHANEFRIRISETSGRVRRLSSVQTLSKRKALETGPSTSTPTKRAKLHGNSCDSSDIVRKNSKTEEIQPREIALRTRKEDLPLKRKEIIKDEDGEGRDKCPRAREMVREKRPRMLVLGDESDEDMLERDEAPASPKSDGEGKKVSGVKVAAEMSLKKDSHAVGFAKTGLAGSGKKVVGKQPLQLAGENNLVPLRSAFPLHAKKKAHPPVPGDSKSNTGAGFAAHITDEDSPRKRIPCTECKRIRLVNADEDLKTPSCCCERNTRNPKYASRSAPQELSDHCEGEEIHDSKLKLRSERDAGNEGQEIMDQKSQFAKEKAQRNMVWVKVGGKDFWWPGLIVTVVPPAIQKKIDESVDTPKAVRLFHPRKDVEEYQVVKRSSLKPFHLCLSYKDSSSHPDFIVAVIEADQYVSQPDSQMEGFSQLGTSSKEGPRLSGLDDYARCHVDVPHEHAGSNELVLEDVEMPGIDPQCSQVQTENEKETLEDGEVNQAPVEKGTGGISPDARNGSGLSDKRDDLQFSQPQANNEKGVLEDEEVLQVPVGQGKAEDSLEAGHGDVSRFKRDSQCSPSQGDQVERQKAKDLVPEAGGQATRTIEWVLEIRKPNDKRFEMIASWEHDGTKLCIVQALLHSRGWVGYLMQNGMPDARVVYCTAIGASDQGNDQNSPEATNGFDMSYKRDEVSSSTMNEMEGSKKFQTDAIVFEDLEASDRIKASEISGIEEPFDPFTLNLEITPTRRLIAYDDNSKELYFEDGTAVSIETVSLAKEFNKCSTGLRPHECIYHVGKPDVRSRFPKVGGRSSGGLNFNLLDPNANFAMRLRDTWLREYKDEPMPENLRMRFVAACIVEERGEPVNWAFELANSVRAELKQHVRKKRDSLSPGVLKLIVHLLEKQAPPAAASLPVFEAVKEEEAVDFTEYDHCCHQCKHGGELLCCDGRGCRKTFHLQCLDPPLEEVPETAFYCPSCLAKASTPPGVEGGTGAVVEDGIKLHTDDVFRSEPQGVAESSTFVGDIDTLECRASVDSRTNVEAGMVTTEFFGELPSSKSDEKCCTPSADTLEVGVPMLANNSTKGAAHPVLDTNGHEHAALVSLDNSHVVRDRSVSQMDLDAPAGGDLQINSSPGLSFDSLQAKKHLLSIDPVESDLEEGEFSPFEQAKIIQGDISASEIPCSSTPPLTQEVSTRVDLPFEEDEFPSSDDHNSICEGCDVGGELMYVTSPSFTPAPSSSLMLCDGKGCKVVYHKECLDPPLQTVPAGEWYCPECEKRKVEKIWSVRNVDETSKRRVRAAANGSDTSSPESDSEDDMPLDARFKSSLQRPDGEVAASDLGKASGSRAGIKNTSLKSDGVEYLVQWKSRSHAHDKWVSEKELEKQAPKELARFKKSLQLGQVKYDSEWAEPERVIQKRLTRVTRRQPDLAVQKGNFSNHRIAEIEWFVKWKGLGYENCTWEPSGAGVLATSRGIELIKEYERWTDAAKQRARRESQEEAESRFQVPLKCQPEWMIRPEQEQLDAYNKLLEMWHSRMNGIIMYEASQEKIVMTIMFFLSLVEHCRVVHPILVVVPKSLIQNWEHELYKWASKLYIVNYASKLEEARDIIRRAEFNSFIEPFRPQIVLTTFDVINCDTDHLKKVEWEVLIIDESRSQRLQKSLQKSYRPFSQINSTFRLLLLSEPLKSNVEELTQFVNFLEPLKSWLPHGDESTQVAELRRRLTGRVFEYIPKNRLTEYWVPVEMTPVHLDQYYNLLVRNYPTLSRNHRDHQIQDVVSKLRQSCNHPFLADPALEGTMGQGLTPKELLDHHIEISGKMRLLHFMMPILTAAGWRVIIFSQETKQLDILERYMTQSHGSDSYERVDHDIAVNAKEAALQRFNAEGSKRFVLLLKTGMHVSFKNVQFVLIYDSDWNPENDMRALHKIHNEGEAGSKPLPVLRLYTHLTVEESTLALSRDEQLPPTRASFSAKICQKLLAWGASKIFDHVDNSKGHTRSSYRPKGAKFCPKAKLKQVVYNSEVVSKMLEALLCQDEVSSKFEGDVLLEAILVPRDEPAPLFAECDHPINMITGDSAQVFWGSSLKWRHDDWQAKKGNTLGKGQRGKKRITYDEDAMASAVFNKAQISEESERKRPRRRKGSSEEAQEVVTAPSDPVSFQQGLPSLSSIPHSDSILPVTSPQVDTALPCDSTLPVTSPQGDTALPCDSTLPVTSPQVDTGFPCDSNLPVTSTQVDIVLPSGSTLPLTSTQVDIVSSSGSTLPLASTQVDTALTSVIPDREQLQESTDPVSFEQGLPSLSSGVHSDSTLPVTSPQVDIALPCGSSLLVTSTQVDTALPCDIPDREQLQENTDPVSFQQWLPSLSSSVHSDSTLPVTSTEVDTALPSDIPEREHLQENTVSSPSHQSEVARSAHGSLRNDHATNENAGSERNRSDAAGMLAFDKFPAYLSKICCMLDLPGPAKVRAVEIFKHFLQCQKQFRKSRPPHEIFAIQLCVVWMAAEQFNHAIDKAMSISLVEERLCVSYRNRDQFVGELYKKVKENCNKPAPLVNVPTTSQPALVPEITPPRTSLLNHPPIAGFELSPENVLPQAMDAAEPARNQLEGSPGTGLQVETEVLLPESQSVQETLPGDNALEAEGAQAVVEPVGVEVGTEVVLVEADPRLVPEKPLDMLISQSRVPEYEPIQVLAGTITSSDSSLEQGLGWVLVSPVPEISVGDLSLTGQPLEASGSERVSNSESHIGSSQSDEAGLASATLGASPMEVPRQVLPTESTQPARQNEQTAAAPLATPMDRLKDQDRAFIINVQLKEMQLMKSEADRKLQVLKRQHDDCRLGLSAVPGMAEEKEKQYKQDKNILERKFFADSKALGTRQRADRDKLDDLYSKLISSASGNGSGVDLRKIEEEIQRIKDYYIKLMHAASTPSPLQESVGQRPSLTSMPSSTPATVALPIRPVQVDDSSRVAQSSASPAEEQQRQHLGRVSSSGTPAVSSQRGHAVQPAAGLGLPQSQRPAMMSTAPVPTSSVQRVTGRSQRPAAMSTAAAMQTCGVQTRGQLQRSNTAVRPSPTPNVPRGAPAVSRSVSAPAVAPAVPSSVGNVARPSVPVSVAALAGSVTGHVYPDVLLKEKEKLSKELEKAKAAYESEAQRIKAEYDREAEILHKKYEALLVEQHRSFTRRQQEVQQNIVKVEWNRQLAEALKLREELAARAAVFAGLATQTAVQPLVNQQAPQQISGRPRTTGVPAHAGVSRSTTNTISAGSGITMQPPGTSSTRVSTAPVHHSPRYGMPQNEQSRSSMSEAMAVLAARVNGVGSGINATGSSRAQMESVPPEMNMDVNGSPQPRTSPGVLAPTSPSFQDPILAIIRNSMPSVEANSPSPSETVSSAGASLPNPHLSEPTAGMEYQMQHSQASPQTNPGADSAPIVEGTPVQMTSQVRSGAQEQVANVMTLEMPQNVIYLSDSDD